MQQKILTFDVNGQRIRAPREKVVADSRNYLIAQFRFSEQWDGLLKTAVFHRADGEVYHVILADDRCVIPPEVIIPNRFLVSVFGGDRLTADTVVVEVDASGYAPGGEPPAPTPDLYAQLLSSVETERQLAQAAAVTAGEKAELCQTDADLAGTHAVTASVAADEAVAKANAAAFYAEQSEQSLERAQEALDSAEELKNTLDGRITQTEQEIDALQQEDTAISARIANNENSFYSLDARMDEFETDMNATSRRLSNAEEALATIQIGGTTVPNVNGSGDGDTSLLMWCEKNIVPGLQVLHVGSGITDCPATTCLAFYASDNSGIRRALWLFSRTGNLHFCTYKNGFWTEWKTVAGTAVQ